MTTREAAPPRYRWLARLEPLLVAAALAGSNAASYVLNVVAARVLAPAHFGELSALLAVLVIGVVPAMGLQTVVALRVAGGDDPAPRREFTARLLASGLVTTTAVLGIGALVVLPLTLLLHLDGPLPAMFLVVALAPLTMLGLFHGILQGSKRFVALAGLVALEGVGKVGGALLGLLTFGTSAATMAGAALGSLVVAAVGWWQCGAPLPHAFRGERLGEIVHAIQAMFALVLLLNLDLVLARFVLPGPDAGEYAVGSIVTKIAYWLPQAVAVVVLPRLAHRAARKRTVPAALVVCAGLGASVIGFCAFSGSELVSIIGGGEYASSTLSLWPFALVGALLSMVQVLLFSRLADADRRVTVLMWSAVALEVVLVLIWLHDGPLEVITAAALTAGALTVGSAALDLHRARRPN
ncbi:polysaccharide biosynthesis protein [Allosaccharopolyspora coralli]|uniref:Polysaccharide biosynthesis protein n=1 Tax=Allosaccharopolyspora coralli TaxID=2665642 RepID=A0A5Q3Q2T8_9PSEU|nr:polysaccharide biosynthesis protein [Allosaccharopolyspora coralli]QGK68901.1 polysaccharide biosynthesis protein [Allosaccharopolyspora coralli]